MNLSIIIQAHERIGILEKTLIGLFHQVLDDGECFEVVIVDNKSKQDLQSMITKYEKVLDIQYISRKELEHPFAIASGRNIGIERAKYDTVLVMDSDVYLPPTLVSSLICEISKRNDHFLITAKRIFIDSSKFSIADLRDNENLYKQFPRILSESNYFQPEDNRFSHGDIFENLQLKKNQWAYFYGMFTCFKKASALAIEGYDESFDGHWGYEDIDFSYRFCEKLDPECIVFDKAVVYHQEPSRENDFEKNSTEDRLNKSGNPNWEKICSTIPGFLEWKSEYYKKIAGDIVDV